LKKIFFKLFFAAAAISLFQYCANPGMPTGGPKDEAAPIVEKTSPANYSVNFEEKKISIYFDEFVVLKDMSQKFMMSPPQKKKPNIKLKGKYITIELGDSLREETTYTLDFADAIVDNNEGNPLEGFQYAFSTGEQMDTLSIRGYVQDAFNLRPVENAFVMIYDSKNDSLPLKEVPNYIARTDSAGYFAINNIKKTAYRIITINDNNLDYIFNSPTEPVGYLDTMFVPEARYVETLDTLAKDSVMQRGYVLYSPADIHLMLFTEEDPQQYLTKYDRPRREKFNFEFKTKRTDDLKIDLLGIEEGDDWYMVESTPNMDTLSYWITDSLIYQRDTILAELQYLKTDSLMQLVTIRDTVKLNFKSPKKAKKAKKKKKKDVKIEGPSLEMKAQISSTHDLNKEIVLDFEEPLSRFDTAMVHLFLLQDTLEIPQKFTFQKDKEHLRSYRINHKWQSETNYKLTIDSAAFTSIYNLNNKAFERKFKTQEAEHYGRILLTINNVKAPLIVQVLKDNDKEPIVQSKRIYTDQEVVFDYLNPETYLVKIIVDENDNGKWDTGNYLKNIQPEQVHYFKNSIKIRSNWDVEENWILQ
jgi:hypothetical protein